MKRAPALAQLSRDHHKALVAAQRLRRVGEDCGEARAAFLEFWDRSGARHFRIEEELLLPALAQWGGGDDPLVARTLLDHVAIRGRIRSLRSTATPSAAGLRELGAMLAAHIRMEERHLFGLIEATLPPEELESVARATAAAERGEG